MAFIASRNSFENVVKFKRERQKNLWLVKHTENLLQTTKNIKSNYRVSVILALVSFILDDQRLKNAAHEAQLILFEAYAYNLHSYVLALVSLTSLPQKFHGCVRLLRRRQ